MKKKIGLVTYQKQPKLTHSDSCLVKPLQSLGYEVSAVAWDDAIFDFNKYDSLILRSCWNYHLKYEEFLEWVKKIKHSGITLYNPPELVVWNSNKEYLFDLLQKGVPIIPTKLITKSSNNNLSKLMSENKWGEMIIKTTIGASAYRISKVTTKNIITVQKQIDNLLNESDFLAQPLMKEISEGELSFVYIGKKFSHCVLKVPKENEYRSQSELGATQSIFFPDKNLLSQVNRVIDTLDTKFLYARVDGIVCDGNFLLMELELIEPELYFHLHPQAANHFAQTLTSFF